MGVCGGAVCGGCHMYGWNKSNRFDTDPLRNQFIILLPIDLSISLLMIHSTSLLAILFRIHITTSSSTNSFLLSETSTCTDRVDFVPTRTSVQSLPWSRRTLHLHFKLAADTILSADAQIMERGSTPAD